MPTVHFTSTALGVDSADEYALSLLRTCRTALAEQPGRFRGTDDPGAADFIVFVEPPRDKFQGYERDLLAHDALRSFPERCFVYDWTDRAAGFLPGVYPSLRRSQWDPTRMVTGCFLQFYNEAVSAASQAGEDRTYTPRLLMSFRGSISHLVRPRLAHTPSVTGDPEVEFSLIDSWYTHTDDQKADYVASLLEAKFALCPRGHGPTTYRVYEAMALGRAPVIVSDEWIAPAGPDWSSFALVISEARIADLPRIVREREDDWIEMGRLARQAWHDFVLPPAGVTAMLRAVEQISLRRTRGETLDELRARWSSHRFKAQHDWAAYQRLRRLTTSAEVRGRVGRQVKGKLTQAFAAK